MKYPHIVTIQSKGTGKSATGAPIDTPVDVAAGIYGRVSVLTGREKWLPEGGTQTNDAAVYIRYRDTIKPDMRVIHGSDQYEITAVIPNKRRTELRLVCKRYQR